MNLNNKKRILLAMNSNFEIHLAIENNLKFLGYEVVKILPDSNGFKYPNFFYRILNLFRKVVFNDRSFKDKLKQKFVANKQKAILLKSGKFDYALFIRPDVFENAVIETASKLSSKTIAYQYDGTDRFPNVYDQIKLFDAFYVFDPDDLKKNINFKFATNFYFDYEVEENDSNKTDLAYSYICSYNPGRTEVIEVFYKKMKQIGIYGEICVMISSQEKIKLGLKDREDFRYTREIIPYRDYLNRVKQSKIILDFVITEHSGLSFRVFESIKFEKKLITTNSQISDYDFYTPNNIFIIKNNNLDNIEEFLTTNYVPIDSSIKMKYGFTNWFNYVFEHEPYVPINYPAKTDKG